MTIKDVTNSKNWDPAGKPQIKHIAQTHYYSSVIQILTRYSSVIKILTMMTMEKSSSTLSTGTLRETQMEKLMKQ